MPRAPFQVFVIPYARCTDGVPRYAVFRRADLAAWQGLAGGGEDGETPDAAARLRWASNRAALAELHARLGGRDVRRRTPPVTPGHVAVLGAVARRDQPVSAP